MIINEFEYEKTMRFERIRIRMEADALVVTLEGGDFDSCEIGRVDFDPGCTAELSLLTPGALRGKVVSKKSILEFQAIEFSSPDCAPQ